RDHIRAIMNNVIDGIVTMDLSGNLFSLNASAETIFGYSAAEVIGKNLNILVSRLDDDARHAHDPSNANVIPDGVLKPGAHEVTGRYKEGRLFPLDLAVSEVTLGGNRLLIGIVRDITSRKQTEETLRRRNRTLAMVSHCNKALLRAKDEHEFLDDFCRNIVEIGGYPKDWIDFLASADVTDPHVTSTVAYFDQGEKDMSRSICVPGLGEFLLSTVPELSRDEPMISNNIAADPRLDGRCEELVIFGFRSMICLPIGKGPRIMGLLTICSTEENIFDEEEVRLLRELAADLAVGISFLRTRKAR
ncbi:MAG: PAS domain S-box protein, partial [Pseudomonadota bacterium]